MVAKRGMPELYKCDTRALFVDHRGQGHAFRPEEPQWRGSSEFLEVSDEMGLIVVIAFVGDLGQGFGLPVQDHLQCSLQPYDLA